MSGILTYREFSLENTPSLEGKVALVTGGQMGIGKEITAQLLLHNVTKVYVLSRSREKFNAASLEWKARKGIHLGEDGNRVEFVQCDLSDIAAVEDAANVVKQKADRLHMVFCNAGLGVSPQYKMSRQKIESVFATNCVGHQVLVTLLLPILKQTSIKDQCDVRVVVTGSSMHQLCRELDVDLLTSTSRPKPALYDGVWRYARSKLGNVLFARELTRQLLVQEQSGDAASKNVYVNVSFPGNIVTDQWKSWDIYFGKLLGWMLRQLFIAIGQSVEDGAATAIYLAASDQIVQDNLRGQYFVPIAKRHTTSSLADDPNLARQLWKWIEETANEALGPNWKGS